MKRNLIFTLAVMSIGLMTSCGNSNKSQESQDETANQEAVENVEPVDYAKLYGEAITITAGNVSKSEIPESIYSELVMPLTITNNTAITFSPDDYVIVYEYDEEDTIDGDLETVTKQGSLTGPQLNPNSTAEATIKQEGFELKNNPSVKLQISQEEFEKRYKELSR